LVLAQRNEDNVAVVNPNLFPELSSNQAETLDTVEALSILLAHFPSVCASLWWQGAYHGLESAVPQHLENLGVLLPFLLEGKLALFIAG
jgi:hypothetical protein